MYTFPEAIAACDLINSVDWIILPFSERDVRGVWLQETPIPLHPLYVLNYIDPYLAAPAPPRCRHCSCAVHIPDTPLAADWRLQVPRHIPRGVATSVTSVGACIWRGTASGLTQGRLSPWLLALRDMYKPGIHKIAVGSPGQHPVRSVGCQ